MNIKLEYSSNFASCFGSYYQASSSAYSIGKVHRESCARAEETLTL